MAKEFVKLYVYEDEGQEVKVDSYVARDWDEFMLVSVGPSLPPEALQTLAGSFAHLEKQVIVIPDHIGVKVYGVQEAAPPAELVAADESTD